MWKRLNRFRPGGQQHSSEREKFKKELFSFNKTVEHGFPHGPSAVAFDPKLKLLAIGTKTGVVKIYGAPGVEFIGMHREESAVTQLFFLPEQGRLISLCEDNTLHLWEVNIKDGNSVLEEVKEFSLEGRLKKISVCCLPSACQHLFLGTEGGNIYVLDVVSFELLEIIIYQDVVMQNVPDDYKIQPGAVEAISEHPTDPNKLLIGYNRGLMVLWDNNGCNAEQTYVGSQQLDSLSWHRNGTQFMSAHSDGSYSVWNLAQASKPEKEPVTPYGPFPCKPINKLNWLTTKSEPFVIFSGGMPRASYGDRHCVTVTQGKTHVVFDFTSRVIDFFTISDTDEECEFDDPHTLIVLVEEELVAIDLHSPGWPTFNKPYLASLHASAITCSHHCSNMPASTWDSIGEVGAKQDQDTYSQREWPINGGKNLAEAPLSKDMLLTGHEDGTLRFWDASTISMRLLYTINTSQVFLTEHEQNMGVAGGEGEEEWPPFRKVGTFDPYSDDPRLGVQKIYLCPFSGTLLVGGTAGQVVLLKLCGEETERAVETYPVNVVSDRDEFMWKGHDALTVKAETLKMAPGFQTQLVVQASPPAAITALALQSQWNLVSFGTSHGFAIFDGAQCKEVASKCTLNPSDLTASGETPMSRSKHFKKSLRESFRRLRRRRSGPKRPSRESKEEKKAKIEEVAGSGGEGDAPAADKEEAVTPSEEKKDEEKEAPKTVVVEEKEAAPVERKIEARSTDDTMTSMVRSLYFANTFIRDAVTPSYTLWAGTNAGKVFIYTITVPDDEKRTEEAVTCELGKEIQLKHRAPVVAVVVIDKDGFPLPLPGEVENERAKSPNMSGGHLVVICSEEQFKTFYLPSLKPKHKHKLTAHDGSRVRRVAVINYRSRSDESYSENCLTCLTNQGELGIYSIPHVKPQYKAAAIRKEDITGISSATFTTSGQGFYLLSSSEYERFSLSARYITEPMCMLELAEGMRPQPPEPEPEPEETAEEAKEEEGEGEAAAAVAGEAAPQEDGEEEAAKEGEDQDTPAAAAATEAEEAEGGEQAKAQDQEDQDQEEEAQALPEAPQTADELVDEVDLLLAQSGLNGGGSGDANDTVEEENSGENPDITVDEVKDHLMASGDNNEEEKKEEDEDE